MKKLLSNYQGGLRLNWNDLRWMQDGIIEAIGNLVKALGNQTPLFIVSGCATRSYTNNMGYENLVISPGIISVNGELMSFAGCNLNLTGSNIFFWFTINEAYDGSGAKTDKTYTEVHQCYTTRTLVINNGLALPTTD